MSDTEIKRYCINREGNDMVATDYGAFCFHHEIKDLIAAKNARIAELETVLALVMNTHDYHGDDGMDAAEKAWAALGIK